MDSRENEDSQDFTVFMQWPKKQTRLNIHRKRKGISVVEYQEEHDVGIRGILGLASWKGTTTSKKSVQK